MPNKFRTFWSASTKYFLSYLVEIKRVRWMPHQQMLIILLKMLLLILTVGSLFFGFEKLLVFIFEKIKIL